MTTEAAPVAAEPAHVEAAPVEAVAAPAPAPAPAQPAAAPASASLDTVLEQAGLVWVNTDAGKFAAAQEAASRLPRPARVPRERGAAAGRYGPDAAGRNDASLIDASFDRKAPPAGFMSALRVSAHWTDPPLAAKIEVWFALLNMSRRIIPLADVSGMPDVSGVAHAPDGTLADTFAPLRDLRISVTDRCNFRCV